MYILNEIWVFTLIIELGEKGVRSFAKKILFLIRRKLFDNKHGFSYTVIRVVSGFFFGAQSDTTIHLL